MPQDRTRRTLVDGALAARIRPSVEEGSHAKLQRDFFQYKALQPQVNQLMERMTQLKNAMKAFIDEHGEVDDRGHKVITFSKSMKVGEFTFKGVRNEARRTTYMDADAEEILKELGVYEECTRTVVEIDQDRVYDAFQRGLIPDARLKDIFKTKITWAFKADE